MGSPNCQTVEMIKKKEKKKKPSPQIIKEMKTYLLYILYIVGITNLYQQFYHPNYMYSVHYSDGDTAAY